MTKDTTVTDVCIPAEAKTVNDNAPFRNSAVDAWSEKQKNSSHGQTAYGSKKEVDAFPRNCFPGCVITDEHGIPIESDNKHSRDIEPCAPGDNPNKESKDKGDKPLQKEKPNNPPLNEPGYKEVPGELPSSTMPDDEPKILGPVGGCIPNDSGNGQGQGREIPENTSKDIFPEQKRIDHQEKETVPGDLNGGSGKESGKLCNP